MPGECFSSGSAVKRSNSALIDISSAGKSGLILAALIISSSRGERAAGISPSMVVDI
jgi:hypothetical protein